MSYLFKCLIFVVAALFPNNLGAYYSREDLHKATFGSGYVPFAHLCSAPLNNSNLDKVDFNSAWLIDACFRKSSLKKASLRAVCSIVADFRWTDLEGADLSKGNFTRAYFYGANLKGIKAKDANFKDVTGLTNKQKAILRRIGAKNVPKNLNPEEFEVERLRVEEELRSPFMEKLNKILDPVLSPLGRGLDKALTPPLMLLEKIFDKTLGHLIDLIK